MSRAGVQIAAIPRPRGLKEGFRHDGKRNLRPGGERLFDGHGE